eukprot:3548538-Pyramimonas_sp.AAC.1
MPRVAPQWQVAPRGCWVAPTCCPPSRWADRPSPASSSQRRPDRQAWACHCTVYSCAATS